MSEECKIMSAKEAISRFVNDGDELIIGNYTVGACFELMYEVIRQQKKGLTVFSQSGLFDVDLLVEAGCVDRLVTAYVMRYGGRNGGGAVERALNDGTLEMEDYTNFQYNARLEAGKHGFSFMPVLEAMMTTDTYKKRSFMGENKYRTMTCPFTGKKLLLVPAANPDVCILHVQRSDKFGNAQYWGALGSVAAAALASKRVIVSCEEIVDHEIIKSNPQLTIVPSFRVDAVVEAPWGAHPTEVLGFYNADTLFWGGVYVAAPTSKGLKAWMDEWIFGCPDRDAYIKHYVELYGVNWLNRLKAKPYYSAPVNLGAAFSSVWDHNGHERMLGLSLKEIEEIMHKRGLI